MNTEWEDATRALFDNDPRFRRIQERIGEIFEGSRHEPDSNSRNRILSLAGNLMLQRTHLICEHLNISPFDEVPRQTTNNDTEPVLEQGTLF